VLHVVSPRSSSEGRQFVCHFVSPAIPIAAAVIVIIVAHNVLD
jgi:hypothetical protein